MYKSIERQKTGEIIADCKLCQDLKLKYGIKCHQIVKNYNKYKYL